VLDAAVACISLTVAIEVVIVWTLTFTRNRVRRYNRTYGGGKSWCTTTKSWLSCRCSL